MTIAERFGASIEVAGPDPKTEGFFFVKRRDAVDHDAFVTGLDWWGRRVGSCSTISRDSPLFAFRTGAPSGWDGSRGSTPSVASGSIRSSSQRSQVLPSREEEAPILNSIIRTDSVFIPACNSRDMTRVVPVRFPPSSHSEATLREAAKVAEDRDADLTVLHVDLYQNSGGVSRGDLKRAVEQRIGRLDRARYVVRRGSSSRRPS